MKQDFFSKFAIAANIIAIHQNPYQGLKHQIPIEDTDRESGIAIHQNPYQGLKQPRSPDRVTSAQIAIHQNPYQGLKPISIKEWMRLGILQFIKIPIRD